MTPRRGVIWPLLLGLLVVAFALGLALVGDAHFVAAGTEVFQGLRLDYEMESLLEVAFNTLKESHPSDWTASELATLVAADRQAMAGGRLSLTAEAVGSAAVRLHVAVRGGEERDLWAMASFEPVPPTGEPGEVLLGAWRLTLLPPPS